MQRKPKTQQSFFYWFKSFHRILKTMWWTCLCETLRTHKISLSELVAKTRNHTTRSRTRELILHMAAQQSHTVLTHCTPSVHLNQMDKSTGHVPSRASEVCLHNTKLHQHWHIAVAYVRAGLAWIDPPVTCGQEQQHLQLCCSAQGPWNWPRPQHPQSLEYRCTLSPQRPYKSWVFSASQCLPDAGLCTKTARSATRCRRPRRTDLCPAAGAHFELISATL